MNRPKQLRDYQSETGRFVPRYELLRRLLIDEILSSPPEREFLPFQEQLASRYRVSRNTVRRALGKLRSDGYITTGTRSGSRILRRTVEAHRPVVRARGFDQCVGVVMASTHDNQEHDGRERWSLLNALEQRFGQAGIRTVVYNLREDFWNAWKDPDRFEQSLAENRINQLISLPSKDPRNPWPRLFPRVAGRRILYAVNDTFLWAENISRLRNGDGVAALNHLGAIRTMLSKISGVYTGAAYLTAEFARTFSDRRGAEVAEWAAMKRIPFRYIVLPSVEKKICPGIDFAHDICPNAVQVWGRERPALGRAPLVFGCNDQFLYHFFRISPPEPDCEYVGYDDSHAPELRISSFGQNSKDWAETLFRLYAQGTDLPTILLVSPRFIDRFGMRNKNTAEFPAFPPCRGKY